MLVYAHCRYPKIAVEINDCFSLLSLFGSDQDDTAGCLCTKNCSRTGILQHMDVFDIVRVDIRQLPGINDPIKDDERITPRIQRSPASDLQAGTSFSRCAEANV